jgi:hypothetical protein
MLVIPWSQLAHGQLARDARELVVEAAEILISALPGTNPSLARGDAGRAIALDYVSRCGLAPEGVGRATLQRAVDHVHTLTAPGLFAGVSGVAWASTVIDPGLLLDGTDDLHGELCDALLVALARTSWTGHDDLIAGLVGIGLYGIAREETVHGREIVRRVIGHLERRAQHDRGGLAWPMPRDASGNRRSSPGVAHGVAGALAFLAEAHGRGHEPERTSALVERGLAWLSAVKLPTTAGGRYPRYVDQVEPSGAAWCTGDAGIAGALVAAATWMQGPQARDMRDTGLVAAESLLMPCRSTPDPSAIDLSFCHGAAGMLHIYNRLWQLTHDPRYGAHALSWLSVIVAGRARVRELPSDFLDGCAGVVCAVAAAIAPIAPTWDRPFLLMHKESSR